jgi:hypothetical protein
MAESNSVPPAAVSEYMTWNWPSGATVRSSVTVWTRPMNLKPSCNRLQGLRSRMRAISVRASSSELSIHAMTQSPVLIWSS